MGIEAFMITETARGFCTSCQKPTESLHKCPDCGKYVYRPMDTGRDLSRELRIGKHAIREKHLKPLRRKLRKEVWERYKDAITTARKNKDFELVIQLSKSVRTEVAEFLRNRIDSTGLGLKIKEEIRQYLAPGKAGVSA